MAWSNTHYDALDCSVMGLDITGLSETMCHRQQGRGIFHDGSRFAGDVPWDHYNAV